MRQLTTFKIDVRDTDFVLSLEDDAGELVTFSAGREQIEDLIVALDELLGDDEEEDAEPYQKMLG